MATVTKADLESAICDELGASHADAKAIVEGVFGGISNALINGNSVKLSGFGNFDLRDKVARPGRNPKTGESAEISARRVVTFKASDKCKEQIQ